MRWPWPTVLGALGAAVATLLVARRVSDSGGGNPFGSWWDPPAPPVDPYAPQETNHPGACDPVAKPGVLAFRAWALGKWGQNPGTAAHPTPQNIGRACSEGQSEHEQGRAWDLMTNSLEHGQAIVDALLAPEGAEPDALARRAGIMYMIWNKQMWRAYPHGGLPSGSWAPYTGGESAHTDHIHFSFSKAGADGQTSLYGMIGAGDVA